MLVRPTSVNRQFRPQEMLVGKLGLLGGGDNSVLHGCTAFHPTVCTTCNMQHTMQHTMQHNMQHAHTMKKKVPLLVNSAQHTKQ